MRAERNATAVEKTERVAGIRSGDGLDCVLPVPHRSYSAQHHFYEVGVFGVERVLAR